MAQITYKYNDIEYIVDYDGESGKIVVERNPFNIANERVASYITSGGTYSPGELISVPNSNMTFNAVMRDAGLVTVTDSNNVSHDISDMVLNVVSKTGKNQPFSYVVLTVSRQLFIEANIKMIQKVTEFQIDVFGISGKWIYERLEDNGSYYDITLVNKAYYLKNITLLSLFNFSIPTPYPNDTTIVLTNVGLVSTITWDGNEGHFPITFDNKSLTVYIKRNIYTVDSVETTDYSLTRISNCNPDDLFYFLAKYVAKYNTSDIVIQPGYYYTGILTGGTFNISDKYTMSEIEVLKAGKTTIPANNSTFNSVSIRLDEFCWDILQSLAYLSNREIIFDNKAYFMPVQTSYTLVSGYTSFTRKQDYIGLYIEVDGLMTFVSPDNYNTLTITPGSTEAYEGETLSIDWEPPESPISHVKYVTTLALCENDDQGSQYLTASQKVISEAYETTIAISDTSSSYVGRDIKYLAVDSTEKDDDDTNNSVRNTQAKIVALNALIKNFKPGDCIEYSVNETKMPTPDRTITSWDQFNTLQPSDTCFKFQTMLNDTIVATETYYTKSGQKWFEYDTNNPLRETGYGVNACAAQITDAHNNITLTNVPLALKTVEYPACVTTYTWGNPEFMDEQSQFNDLSAVSQDSVLDNTSDTGISSGDATKLVVGNQYVHQLRDDRAGFTGLIMEKNLDNNVYRLVGYNKGVVQAQFNSEGRIEAGAGVAQLDENGLTVYYDSNDTEYSPQNALKFQKSDEPDLDENDNPLTPYRLYAKYDSGTTTSVVQAQKQTLYHLYPTYTSFNSVDNYVDKYVKYNDVYTEVTSSNKNSLGIQPGETEAYTTTQHPAKLKMVCDEGGIVGAYTTYTTNASTNINISTVKLRTYESADWTGSYTETTPATHEISIPANSYCDIYVTLSQNTSSIAISTPSSSQFQDCAFIAHSASPDINYTFKSYDDNSESAKGVTYIYTNLSNVISAVAIRVKNITSSAYIFYLDRFPINIFKQTGGDGTSIILDQTGTTIVGNTSITGQFYQKGGPIHFAGAGVGIPAYFDMPVVAQMLVSQGNVYGGRIDTRYTTLNDLACRRIYITPTGSQPPQSDYHEGDIILYYTP